MACSAALPRIAAGATAEPGAGGNGWVGLPGTEGVPGVSYFNATTHPLPPGTALFLDGRNVTGEATAADLSRGWVNLLQVAERRPDGTPARFACPVQAWKTWGEVELRPKPLSPESPPARARLAYLISEFRKGKWVTVARPVCVPLLGV